MFSWNMQEPFMLSSKDPPSVACMFLLAPSPFSSYPANTRFRGKHERWSEMGTIFRNAKATAIHDAERFEDLQTPHRVIVILSTSSINEEEITISELEMLLSWMLGGMGRQTFELGLKGVPYDRYHMLFPVP